MNKSAEPPGDGAQTRLEASSQLNSATSSSPPLEPSPVTEIPTSSCPPAPARQPSAHDSAQTQGRRATVASRVEVRLLVRRREAGALIGKRGANIKRLRETFSKSTFNIPDTGNGPERVVCIAADSLASVEAILADLAHLFLEKSCQLAKFQPPANPGTRRNQDLDQIELKQLINSSHAGLLIGMGGQSIRKLRNDSKAAIKIYEMCCPNSNERVCAIKAKPPVVVSALKMIQAIIDAAPAALKASIVCKPYDALNYDLSLIDKYGGYAPDDLGPLELMQLAGARTANATSAALDVHQLIGSNSQRRQLYNQSTPLRTNHVRSQASVVGADAALALAPHQAGLLPDGIGALLSALNHGLLSTHLRRRLPAPLVREPGQRGHGDAARYHPYLLAASSSPPLTDYAARPKHHLQEHERLLIAQHLQMLSASQHQLLRASTCGVGCSCYSHGQHQRTYIQQQQQQQQSDDRASSSCSCASASCKPDLVRRAPKVDRTSGEWPARKFADSCQQAAPPSAAHEKQTTQGQPPV